MVLLRKVPFEGIPYTSVFLYLEIEMERTLIPYSILKYL